MKISKILKSGVKTAAAVSCGYAAWMAVKSMKAFDPMIGALIAGVVISGGLLFVQASEDLVVGFGGETR